MRFLLEAANGGDKKAAEILQILKQLDEEYSSIHSEISIRMKTARITMQDHKRFYSYAISGLRRLQLIPGEKQRILRNHLNQKP